MPSQTSSDSNPNNHPTDQQILVFLSGGGVETFRDAVKQHLKVCAKCASIAKAHRPRSKKQAKLPGENESSMESRKQIPVPIQLSNHPQFEIERELGRGGMGIVYLAKHRLTGRQEALKILMPELAARPDIRTRFLREIKAAAQLDHPNICRAYSAFDDRDLLGFVMEYIPGRDLATYIQRQGTLSVRSAALLGIQICLGLEHANQKGMVHRDIKPANLMVIKEGSNLQVKILDFGLTRGTGQLYSRDPRVTQDGRVLGTPEYISPEQAINSSETDIRSDLYSLGCTLYYTLTGKPPFEGGTIHDVLVAHQNLAPVPIPALNSKVPQEFWKVIRTLLEKAPEDRPSSPTDVIKLLQPFVLSQEAQAPDRPSPREPVGMPPVPSKRIVKKRKNNSAKLVSLLLPPILACVTFYMFQKPIMEFGRTLLGSKTSGTLVLDQLPDDFEVWIDGRPVDFRRPTAGSPAQVVAEPGKYKLSLRKNGRSLRDLDISIEAGQELRLQVDDSFLGQRVGDLPINNNKNNRDLVNRNSNSNSNSNTTESSNQIASNPPTPSVSDEAIATAIDAAIKAINARQPDQALKELSPVYVSNNNHAIADAHPEFNRVKDLVQFARSLDAFLKAVEKSFTKLAPGLTIHVGPHPVSVVDANELKIILRHKGENVEFDRQQLPSNLEQSLADLILTETSPSNNLSKASGALTHKKLSAHGIEVCKEWIADAIESKLVSENILKTIDVFCNRELNRVEKDEPMIAKRWEELEDPDPEFTETHELVRKLEGSVSPIASMFLFPNLPAKQMSLIASGRNQSGFGSSRVHLWNLQSGVHYEAQSAVGPLWSAECSDNGNVVAILSAPAPQTNLQVYSGNLIKPIFQLSEVNDSRSAIELSPDGRFLAGVGPNESFIRWNLAKRDVVTRIVSQEPVGEANVVCMAIRDNLEAVAVASKNGGVVLWHASDGRELARFSVDDKDNPNPAIAMRFCKGGSRLVVIRQNGMLELYDTNKLVLEKQVRATSRGILAVGATLSAPNHAKFIAIADSHRNIRLWDGTNVELVGGFHDHHQSPITSVAIDANADKIAVGCEDGGVSVWKKK